MGFILSCVSIILVLFSILVCLLIDEIFFKPQRLYGVINQIPGPPTRWLFGNTLDLNNLDYNLSNSLKWAKSYGKMYRLWLGPLPLVVLTHPDTAKVLLQSNINITKSRMYDCFLPYLGHTNLLLSTGAPWKARRKLLTGSFHSKTLQQYVKVFVQQAEILLQQFGAAADQKQPIDVFEPLGQFTLRVISSCAFNYTIKEESTIARTNFVINESIRRCLNPWLWPDLVYFLTPSGRKLKAAVTILHKQTDELIENRMKESESDKRIRQANYVDFLDILLDCRDENGQPVPPQGIRDEVTTFLFAGTDTTSHGISYILYSLAQNPEVQEKVYQEIISVLGSDKDPTSKDLEELPYLTCVVKEAHRLYSPVPIVSRTLDQDIVVDGFNIPKGVNVTVRPWIIHRHPEVWPEPEKFIPERFSKNGAEFDPFAFVPFSAGPRNCIGQKFALNEERVAVAMILQRFQVRLNLDREDPSEVDGCLPPVVLQPSLVLRAKHGIQIYFRRR